MEFLGVTHSSINISRQEIPTSTNVLERFHLAYMEGEEIDPDQPLSFPIVDDIRQTAVETTTSLEQRQRTPTQCFSSGSSTRQSDKTWKTPKTQVTPDREYV